MPFTFCKYVNARKKAVNKIQTLVFYNKYSKYIFNYESYSKRENENYQ
ncbi:hypothetical protein SAMN05216405_4306 [Lachnospiraceae bacterium NLAE-zl-G231]|nr:hypothetical protein SAMN05216405_4306 [Lachnospiraceae bacterium NLAE-zl-G231]